MCREPCCFILPGDNLPACACEVWKPSCSVHHHTPICVLDRILLCTVKELNIVSENLKWGSLFMRTAWYYPCCWILQHLTMCPGNPVAGGETPALPCLIVTLELIFCFRPFVLLIHRRAEGLRTPCWLDSFQFSTAFPEADERTGEV